MLRCLSLCSNLAQHVSLSHARGLLASPTFPPVRLLSTSVLKRASDGIPATGININIETDLDHTQPSDADASGHILEPILPLPANKDHNDLPSFLAHSRRIGASTTSNTYRGTYYEYLTALTLRRYGFELVRVGGRGDKGIDLVGTWTVPDTVAKTRSNTTKDGLVGGTGSISRRVSTQKLRVLVQCKWIGAKTSKAPHLIRELEGAVQGVSVPVGWRGPGVLSILVATRGATKGVRDAMAGSRRAMGWMMLEALAKEEEKAENGSRVEVEKASDGVVESSEYVEEDHVGKVRQILWNKAASTLGLEGLEVVTKYDAAARKVDSDGHESPGQAVLMWQGKIYPGAHGSSQAG